MAHGVDPVIPGDKTRQWLWNHNDPVDEADCTRCERQKLHPSCEAARIAQENAARVMKRNFDKYVTKRSTFVANSYVLIRNESPKKSVANG